MLVKILSDKASAVINTLGAELVSLTDSSDTQYLWQGSEDSWNGQAPNLFPVVGRLKDQKIIINGGEYSFDSHGFSRKSEFTVVTAEDSKVSLSLKSDENTKKMYPFDFEFIVTFELDGARLEQKFEVINSSDEPMTFGIGGHPGFNIPLSAGEAFEDYRLIFEKNETINAPFFTQKEEIDFSKRKNVLTNSNIIDLNYDLFKNDAIIMDSPASKEVSLVHKKSGKGIKMQFEDFEYFAFWTKVGAPFLCLEPWNGLGACADETSEISSKRGMITIGKNERRAYSFYMTII